MFHMLPSGGGIRVLKQFAEGFRKRDRKVTVYVPRGGSLLGSPGETVIPYPMWRRPSGLLKLFSPVFLPIRLLAFKSVCREAARLINREGGIALVHNAMPVAAPPVLQYLAVPSVYFCFEYPRHIYEKDIISRTGGKLREHTLKPLEELEKRIDYESAVAANRILTFSTHMGRMVKNTYGMEPGMVRPGIDSEFFYPSSTGKKKGYVLSVGALWPFKGHETAIRIIAELPPDSRPSLTIVGDREFPSYLPVLRHAAESADVSLTVRRNVKDTELRELYRGASAVLCCQRKEPYGLVPLEAMACGTPVVAIAEGGFTDNVFDGRTGLLFDGSVGHGARKLAEALDHGSSIRTMTTAAHDFVKHRRTVDQGVSALLEELDSI